MSNRVVAKGFAAKDYSLAVKHKEEVGGIMLRILTPTGVIYEVRYLPPLEPSRHLLSLYTVFNRMKCLKIWPSFGILKK